MSSINSKFFEEYTTVDFMMKVLSHLRDIQSEPDDGCVQLGMRLNDYDLIVTIQKNMNNSEVSDE